MVNPPPGWSGSASSRSLLNRIEKSRVTPFSCMVAPKMASAAETVRLLWVMMRNWEKRVNSRMIWVKRPTFVSSRGASS